MAGILAPITSRQGTTAATFVQSPTSMEIERQPAKAGNRKDERRDPNHVDGNPEYEGRRTHFANPYLRDLVHNVNQRADKRRRHAGSLESRNQGMSNDRHPDDKRNENKKILCWFIHASNG